MAEHLRSPRKGKRALKGCEKGKRDGRQRRPKMTSTGARISRKLGPGAPVTISNKKLRRELGSGVFIIVVVDNGLARLERQANHNMLSGEIPLSFLQPARLQLGR